MTNDPSCCTYPCATSNTLATAVTDATGTCAAPLSDGDVVVTVTINNGASTWLIHYTNNCISNFYGEMYIENGNVFDISKKVNWNKAKFMPIDLIDSKNNPKIYDYNYSERQLLMFELVKKLSNACITPLKRFDSFDEGWKYVLDNNSEGLIMRNEDNWFKIKLLKEAKVKIKEHEVGKDKGTFILDDENNNRVSGTSTQFVLQYLKIKKEGKEAIAEIEYPFITKNGNYFQPRLRQITERIYEVDK